MRLRALAVLLAAGGLSCRLLQPAVTAPETPQAAPVHYPAIPAPDPRAAEVPDGYVVEVVLKDLVYPSSLEIDDRGHLYVAEAGYVYGDHHARARVLRLSPDGTLATLDGLDGPVTDLLWHDGALFISSRGRVSRLGPDGRAEDIVTGLPSLGDHANNQLSAGPDGWLYLGQGTATNSGVVGLDNFLFLWLPLYPSFHDRPAQDLRLADRTFTTMNPFVLADPEAPKTMTTAAFRPLGQGLPEDGRIRGTLKANGTILRFRPDGSGLQVHAWGLRNPFGLAWGPDGHLYVAENGFDVRGTRPVAGAPDVLWRIRPGAWYGWPDFAAGRPVTDPRFKPEGLPQPEFLMAEHPPVETAWLERPPHSAVAKLDFSRSRDFGFEGHLFLAEFGDLLPLTGPQGARAPGQVVRIDPKTRAVVPFFRARGDALGPAPFEHAATAGPRRPLDVRFSPDGRSMYVVDLGAMTALPTKVPMMKPFPGTGVVWKITRSPQTR